MSTKSTDKGASEAPADEVDVAQAIGALPFRGFHYLQVLAVVVVFLGAGTTTASLSWIEDDVRSTFNLSPAQELPIVFISLSAVTLSLFTAGATSDQLGRRPVCLAGLWGLLAFQMSIGAAQSPAAVAICFGLRGLALHYGEDVAKGYLAEMLPAQGRGKVLNLMHAAWQLGGILFSFITLFTTAYAPLAVLSSLPVLLALALFLSFTIESPLWVDKNRGHTAGLRQLRRMYAKCNEPWPYDLPAPGSSGSLASEPADSSSAPLLAKPGKEGRRCSDPPSYSFSGDGHGDGGTGWCCCNGSRSGGGGDGGSGGGSCPCGPRKVWACLQRAYGPLLGEHRKLTGLITLLYISLQLGTWSNDTWLKRVLGESGREGLQTAASFVQYGCKFCGAIISGMLVERTGRKLLLIPCFALVALGTALIGLSTSFSSAQGDAGTRLFFGAMLIVYVPVEILSSTLGTYTYEIFPTRVRIASLGVARGTAGVLGTVYSSAGPLIMDSAGPSGLFYINASILCCGCAACLLITRDTTGTTLS